MPQKNPSKEMERERKNSNLVAGVTDKPEFNAVLSAPGLL